jgi:hypothetical protein
MALTHRTGVIYTTDIGAIANTTETITGDAEVNVDHLIPAGATDYVITIGVTVTEIVSMVLFAGSAMTVTTNGQGGGADDTFVLSPNHQTLWNTSSPLLCPLTADVVTLHVVNPAAAVARLRMSCLLNAGA